MNTKNKIPGKLPFGDLPQNRIVGANHFEVRNHKTTTQVLNRVFDRSNSDPSAQDPSIRFFKLN